MFIFPTLLMAIILIDIQMNAKFIIIRFESVFNENFLVKQNVDLYYVFETVMTVLHMYSPFETTSRLDNRKGLREKSNKTLLLITTYDL